jgi:hypothetical protein
VHEAVGRAPFKKIKGPLFQGSGPAKRRSIEDAPGPADAAGRGRRGRARRALAHRPRARLVQHRGESPTWEAAFLFCAAARAAQNGPASLLGSGVACAPRPPALRGA